MKGIISIIVGLLTAWGVFYLDSLFIDWITKDLTGNLYSIMRIVLWITAIAWTFVIALILAIISGKIFYILLDSIELTRKLKKRRK